MLTIRVKHNIKGQYISYLIFPSVRYFSGGMRWISANFRMDTSDDVLLNVLKRTEYYSRLSEKQLNDALLTHRLYTVDTTENQIQILSNKARMEDDDNDLHMSIVQMTDEI